MLYVSHEIFCVGGGSDSISASAMLLKQECLYYEKAMACARNIDLV